MIYRIYPSKDAFITNAQVSSVQKTGSNTGGSPALDVFKLAGVSGSTGVASSASIARTLIQFDLSTFSALTSSGDIPNGCSFYLKLQHSTTTETLPSSFDLVVKPVSQSWDEGRGRDIDLFSDSGQANWIKAASNVSWTSPGGDFLSTYNHTLHFDLGYEDLEVDVTDVVNAWLTGGLANNGFGIMLTSSMENDANDYYLKRFYGRTTYYVDRRPCLEARWDDSLKDDRPSFSWNSTGSLFLYNRKNGQLQNLSVGSGFPVVKISDSSGTLMYVTASFTGKTGIYSASFCLPTGSYSGSIFTDTWFSGSFAFMTSSFSFVDDNAVSYIDPTNYTMALRGMRNEYETVETPRFDVFFRPKSFSPTTVLTGSSFLNPSIVKKAYYRIDNDDTNIQVIPFGTGTVETTRLSYDSSGNYFKTYISNLAPGNVYRIVIMIDEDGQKQVIDNGARFKVV